MAVAISGLPVLTIVDSSANSSHASVSFSRSSFLLPAAIRIFKMLPMPISKLLEMDNCCQDKSLEMDRLRERQSKILWIVLGINVSMFALEVTVGLLAGSTALLADSLDMLGDALVYGFTLYVFGRSDSW